MTQVEIKGVNGITPEMGRFWGKGLGSACPYCWVRDKARRVLRFLKVLLDLVVHQGTWAELQKVRILRPSESLPQPMDIMVTVVESSGCRLPNQESQPWSPGSQMGWTIPQAPFPHSSWLCLCLKLTCGFAIIFWSNSFPPFSQPDHHLESHQLLLQCCCWETHLESLFEFASIILTAPEKGIM